MKWLTTLALATVAGMSLHANAGLLSLSGGNYDLVPVVNKFVYDGVTSYNVGGDLSLTKQANLSFTYLGAEAGYTNTFTAYGNSFNNQVNAIGSNFAVNNVLAGLLDFRFDTNGSWNAPIGADAGAAINGANVYDVLGNIHSFAVILDYTYKGVFYDAVLLFDDTGPGKVNGVYNFVDDDNHDDMLIGLKAVAVPVPATIMLLGLGLIGLGASRRRS